MSDELNAMWANALSVLYNELSGPSFDAWLRPSSPVAFSDGTLLVQVPHEFARDWLETRHSALLSEILTSLPAGVLQSSSSRKQPPASPHSGRGRAIAPAVASPSAASS